MLTNSSVSRKLEYTAWKVNIRCLENSWMSADKLRDKINRISRELSAVRCRQISRQHQTRPGPRTSSAAALAELVVVVRTWRGRVEAYLPRSPGDHLHSPMVEYQAVNTEQHHSLLVNTLRSNRVLLNGKFEKKETWERTNSRDVLDILLYPVLDGYPDTFTIWFRFLAVNNQIMKPNNFCWLLCRLICSAIDWNQDTKSANMNLVTPPTQQSGCPSQTSSVLKLLRAHSDCVVDSTQLSVCLNILTLISGKFQIWLDSRYNYPVSAG